MTTRKDARLLYEKIVADPDFRSRLSQCSSHEVAIIEIQDFAKAHDIPVSREDIRMAITPSDAELRDGDLEQVVGGKTVSGDFLTIIPNVNDTLLGGFFDDYLNGHGGDDKLFGYGGCDEMHGGDGNDELYGGSGHDFMLGDDGNDFLDGGADNDRLVGGDGDDTVSGGDGFDLLLGGSGNDVLSGGKGSDLFIFDGNDGVNTIKDFNPSEGDGIRYLNGDLNDVEVEIKDGNTIVSFNQTTVTLEGVEMNYNQVMSCIKVTDNIWE